MRQMCEDVSSARRQIVVGAAQVQFAGTGDLKIKQKHRAELCVLSAVGGRWLRRDHYLHGELGTQGSRPLRGTTCHVACKTQNEDDKDLAEALERSGSKSLDSGLSAPVGLTSGGSSYVAVAGGGATSMYISYGGALRFSIGLDVPGPQDLVVHVEAGGGVRVYPGSRI